MPANLPLKFVFGLGMALMLVLAAPGMAQACQVQIDSLSFGAVSLDRANTTAGRVLVTCPNGENYDLTLSAGFGRTEAREMRGPGSAELRYNLYIDPSYALVWGDGNGISYRISGGSEPGTPVEHTVYGRMPAQGATQAGLYRDQLTVSVVF